MEDVGDTISNAVDPISNAIDPISNAIDPISDVIDISEQFTSSHGNPILSIPTSPGDFKLLLSIFKENPEKYSVAYQYLLDFQKVYRSGDIARAILIDANSPFKYATENEKIEELYRQLTFTPEWLNIIQILRETKPSYRLLEAVYNEELELIPYSLGEALSELLDGIPEIVDDAIVEIPEIVGGIIEEDIVETVPEVIVSRYPEAGSSTSNAFYDFVTSEFGIKCMVAGSAVVVTAIIVHVLIVYYYKTTYTVVAYKSVSWIPKALSYIKALFIK